MASDIKKKKKTKTQIKDEFVDSMFRLIQTCPPEDFPIFGFKILSRAGRLEDATDIVNNFINEINNKNGHGN